MKTFKLKIITPEKVFFDGDAEQIIVRTAEGDTGILAGHANYAAILPAGPFRIKKGGDFEWAAISGGTIKVSKDETVILAMAAEWSYEIDIDWAKRSHEDALRRIKEHKSDADLKLAEAKLKRSLNRMNISSHIK